MISSFSTALSGLEADSGAINVIGNDLANLNTTGYKANEIEFSALMSQALGVAGNGNQVGIGVSPVTAFANYTQGSLETTGGATDAAIEGNGFFVVQGPGNQTDYTRDGSFQINANGELVTAAGDAVQGWSAAAGGTVNTNGPIGSISVPLEATVPATATTNMSLAVNLNATDTGGTFSAPIQVFDSLGQSHTLTATFTNSGTNTWNYNVTIPAADLTGGGTSPSTVATGTLTFDSTGNLTSPAASAGPQAVAITGLADGAADLSINLNLYNPTTGSSNITQLAEASGLGGTTQNGFAAGQISNVTLQNGGLLVAKYTNGQTVTVGQLAVASIANPDTLTAVGNNYLQASTATSTPAIGTANSGARGQVVAGSLESSTVDIAQEFTSLLTFERSYQANSRVITVSDQLQQATVGLIQG